MIKILATLNNKIWTKEEFDTKSSIIPNFIIKEILLYKNWQDRQARILSKLHIVKQLNMFNFDLNLNDLRKDTFNKPYFNEKFYFSIAHSHQIVVSIASNESNVGIDIELVKELKGDYPLDLFSENECAYLSASNNVIYDFYKLFTRKEALAKLSGKGILFDFKNYDVIHDNIYFDGQLFDFITMEYNIDYMISYVIKSNIYSNKIELMKLD